MLLQLQERRNDLQIHKYKTVMLQQTTNKREVIINKGTRTKQLNA